MTELMGVNAGTVVLIEDTDGYSVVPGGTPLRFVNYFDGMLMRAELMKQQHLGISARDQLANQAGGHGVVWGFDTALGGGVLRLGAGMAIDTAGRLAYLPGEINIPVTDLINRSRDGSANGKSVLHPEDAFAECRLAASPAPVTVIDGIQYYVITVSEVQALCGDEDVYGRLCEEACITASDRPWLINGVVVRAEPLPGGLSLPVSSSVALGRVHLRSRIAAAFFAYEQNTIASQISARGLGRDLWCNGARLPGSISAGVPVGLLAMTGSEVVFLDRWIVARERMEAPARRYWSHIMAMRPENIFLAQVLQFQCHLNQLFRDGAGTPVDDPCADTREALRVTTERMAVLIESYERTSHRLMEEGVIEGETDPMLEELRAFESDLKTPARPVIDATRMLISGGIVELPSAGYLPVRPDDSLSVNQQVRHMMGEGVDLRFCVVRPDFVPHALEEAQHMDRISLIEGLDDAAKKPKVDILVPEGRVESGAAVLPGDGYEMSLDLHPAALRLMALMVDPKLSDMSGVEILAATAGDGQGLEIKLDGAARSDTLPGGGFEFHYAGSFRGEIAEGPPAFTLLELLRQSAIWVSSSLAGDPLTLDRGDTARLSSEMILLAAGKSFRARLDGDLQVRDIQRGNDEVRLGCEFGGSLSMRMRSDNESNQRVVTLTEAVQISASGAPASVRIELPEPSLFREARRLASMHFDRLWSGAKSADLSGSLAVRRPNQPSGPAFTLIELISGQPLYKARQQVNSAALRPGHPAHEQAINALRAIGTALDDQQFDDVAARKLFPRPNRDQSGPTVRATQDWVLFHRRRDKTCDITPRPVPDPLEEPEPEPEVVVEHRHYRVYLSALRDIQEREIFINALKQNDASIIQKLGARPIGVVAFNAGIQSLESPAGAEATWRQHAPGDGEIVYGAVMSVGAARDEGDELARARLGTLGSVIDDVTPVADDLEYEALDFIPDGTVLTAAPHDGIMLIATVPLALSCHEVYRIKFDTNVVRRLLRRISTSGPDRVEAILAGSGAERIGRTVFPDSDSEIIRERSDPLADIWMRHDGGKVARIISIQQRPADDANMTAEEQARRELDLKRSQIIARQVDSTTGAEPEAKIPEALGLLAPCPAFTLLVSREQ